MSRAVVFARYGGPEVLEVVDVEPGSPGPGEALVRVMAAGAQPADCLLRSGRMDAWMPAEFPQRLGNELAGIVEEVGDGVEAVAVDEQVIGWTAPAAYADHVLVAATQLIPKPATMGWEEAGALSASGQTAATAIEELRVQQGETLVVHAAAGGVGTMAVQLAVARGARVIGTASPANHEFLRSLGALPVAYGPGLLDRLRALAPAGVDAALDAIGTEEALRASLDLASDRERLATVAYSPAANALGVRRISTDRSLARLAALADLWRDGRLRVEVQQAYALEQAPDAHRAVETGHVRGKVLLRT